MKPNWVRKPVSSEGRPAAAEALEKEYAELMREADSPNGSWNPEPDQHITGMLRDDVTLSANEMKFVALVKSCCVRKNKPGGRTAWGFTETGKPLTATQVEGYFGWDLSNTLKHAKRPLAYGFIRKNAEGQFGIGARVDGKFSEEPEPPKDLSEDDEVVCTYHLPHYLAVESKRLSKTDRKNFLTGWAQKKEAAKNRLATEKKRLYQLEMDELSAHCKGFGLELKCKTATADKIPTAGRGEAEPSAPAEWYVHTTSVQNGAEPVYKAENESVHTTHIRKQSKADSRGQPQSSSSSSEEQAGRQVDEEPAPAYLPLIKLRDFFPRDVLLAADLKKLDAHLRDRLRGDYSPEAFVSMVAARTNGGSKIRAALLFKYEEGLPDDYCELVLSDVAAQRERERKARLAEEEAEAWRQKWAAEQQGLASEPKEEQARPDATTEIESAAIPDRPRYDPIADLEERIASTRQHLAEAKNPKAAKLFEEALSGLEAKLAAANTARGAEAQKAGQA